LVKLVKLARWRVEGGGWRVIDVRHEVVGLKEKYT